MGGLNKRGGFLGVWHIELPIASGVFGLVCLTVVVALIASRFRRGRHLSQKSSYPRLESLYAVIVAALASAIIVVSFAANAGSAAPSRAVGVRVTAFQWCWRFSYDAKPVTRTGTCLSSHRLPTFEVPAGQTIHFTLTSRDVVHSFWLPGLKFKMAAFPHHVNSFNLEVTRPGRYVGRCAEFCGQYHYAMDFTMLVVPPARFHRWLQASART